MPLADASAVGTSPEPLAYPPPLARGEADMSSYSFAIPRKPEGYFFVASHKASHKAFVSLQFNSYTNIHRSKQWPQSRNGRFVRMRRAF